MKRTLLLVILLTIAGTAAAQRDSVVTISGDLAAPTVKSDRPMHPLSDKSRLLDTIKPWEFHLSMGTAYIGSRYNSASAFGIAPSVVYRPNDKFSFRTSAAFIHSCTLAPGGYQIHGRQQRNMRPLRNPNAMAMDLDMSATYKVNDRLWVGGELLLLGGTLASGATMNPWLAYGGPIELNATAVTAAMRYRLGTDSFLELHMTYINDRTGSLGPLLFGGPYGSPCYYNTTTFGGHLF